MSLPLPSPGPALEDEEKRGTPEAFEQLVGSSPALGERPAISARMFEDRRWREEVARWDGRVKPSDAPAPYELQVIEPSHLEADELRATSTAAGRTSGGPSTATTA